MSQLSKLKSAQTRKDLARILGYRASSLTAIIYKTPIPLKYTTFEIDKKSGGKRTIKAPVPKLKKLQSHLSHVLYQCLIEIEKQRDAKPLSFGFRPDRSIVENAARHRGRRWVLNLDLENFFPSFNFGRVRGFFLKDRSFALHPEVATTIAQIACDGAALPQGSPCSPVISELIAQVLDMRLVRLAKKYGVTYTRYADDLTFSTNQRQFPPGLATPDTTDSSVWFLGGELIGKIIGAGFAVNKNKTRMYFQTSKQLVTGLVVNEKVNIRSEYYRRARVMCDYLFQTGKYFKSMTRPDKEGESPKPEFTSNLNPLEGILSFIYSVTQESDKRSSQEQREHPRAIRKLYRRFLFYKYFIALDAPLIVTEGKTDPIYIRSAVESRIRFHPLLGSPGTNGFQHVVKYFNYGGLSHELLDLGGGTGDLKSIPLDYLRDIYPSTNSYKPMANKPMKHPVIMILDNDDGLSSVAATIKKNFKISFDVNSLENFYHVTNNLYVIKTPEDPGKHTCVEDLFPPEWLQKERNGKKFNPASKIDILKEYGKEIFAKTIVRPNVKNIDFSNFDLLLERICAVIRSYSPVD